jgi:group I intron endonuclease
MSVVYKITNTMTNDCYIGSTKMRIQRRVYYHVYKAITYRLHTALSRSIRNDGWENHTVEILEIAPQGCTAKQLLTLEQKHIDKEPVFPTLNMMRARLTNPAYISPMAAANKKRYIAGYCRFQVAQRHLLMSTLRF